MTILVVFALASLVAAVALAIRLLIKRSRAAREERDTADDLAVHEALANAEQWIDLADIEDHDPDSVLAAVGRPGAHRG